MKLGEIGLTYLQSDSTLPKGYIFQDQEENVFVVLNHVKGKQYRCQFVGHNGAVEYDLEDCDY